ncbi:IS110 family transposase (plasmid) [Deinococcus radiomollis]|uniref:IS110 family transposase n=1 Tax=Deinococcus radiomollis TaxID=468916 RepID=UPI003891B86D
MVVVGIDIGKDVLFAHLRAAEGSPAFTPCALPSVENTVAGCAHLLQWAASHGNPPSDLLVVMEATGVYWETCALTLHQAGCHVSVINPAQIKLFARSVLRRGKTDTMDAEIIARYGVVMQPSVWEPPLASVEELKVLVRERETLLETLTQERNRLHALQHKARNMTTVVALVQQRIDLLKEQITALDHATHTLVSMNKGLSESLNLLLTVPGYGFVTAVSVLAETQSFRGLQSGRQLSAYAGIAPAPNQSGSMTGTAHISKTGNEHLRRTAYLAAVGAMKCKGPVGQYYRQLRARGKPAKVALVALGRKLLGIGFAVVTSGQPYDDKFESKRTAGSLDQRVPC